MRVVERVEHSLDTATGKGVNRLICHDLICPSAGGIGAMSVVRTLESTVAPLALECPLQQSCLTYQSIYTVIKHHGQFLYL